MLMTFLEENILRIQVSYCTFVMLEKPPNLDSEVLKLSIVSKIKALIMFSRIAEENSLILLYYPLIDSFGGKTQQVLKKKIYICRLKW